jgi:hypothetical protein
MELARCGAAGGQGLPAGCQMRADSVHLTGSLRVNSNWARTGLVDGQVAVALWMKAQLEGRTAG